MKENDFIRMFGEVHGSKPYFADAEIVKTENGFNLYSIDGFSETEDFFTRTPPRRIGRNMAMAACADLLVCGVVPEIWLQSWDIDDSRGVDYYREIAEGVEEVLRHYGAKCIGGDLGASSPWSCTTVVQAHSPKLPVTRIARERVSFDLYASGPLGDANLAAFLKQSMPEFELRDPVPSDALFATDTSGGFFDALENFRRVNRGMELTIELAAVLSEKLLKPDVPGLDPIWTLIGGVGEYELIFAVPKGTRAEAVLIGEGTFSGTQENVFRFSYEGEAFGRMKNPPPDYRDVPPARRIETTRNYIREMRTT